VGAVGVIFVGLDGRGADRQEDQTATTTAGSTTSEPRTTPAEPESTTTAPSTTPEESTSAKQQLPTHLLTAIGDFPESEILSRR